jgi:hypothetical protein
MGNITQNNTGTHNVEQHWDTVREAALRHIMWRNIEKYYVKRHYDTLREENLASIE